MASYCCNLLVSEGTDFSKYVMLAEVPVPELRGNEVLLPAQLLDYLLLIVVEASSAQFDSCENIFYSERQDENLDKVGAILDSIFANFQDVLKSTAESLLRADKSASFEALEVIDRRLPQVEGEIQAMEATLKAIQARVLALVQEFVKSEVNAIHDTRFSAKRRSGVFPYVTIFPVYTACLGLEGVNWAACFGCRNS